MKTLIVSCSNGGGHNAVAAALQETFCRHGTCCDRADALSFVSPQVSRLVSHGHSFVYRHAPRLMRRGYELAEQRPMPADSLLYRALAAGGGQLADYIRRGGYDTVLCTHVFAGLMLTACRAQSLQVHSAMVETDYTNSPFAEHCRTDRYFVADRCFVSPLASRGVPLMRIIPCGIPVRRCFYRTQPPSAARTRLHLPPEHRHLVMMCGSMGCGPMAELTERLQQQMSPGQELTVLCGSNRALRQRLTRRYADLPHLHICGHTEDVSLLLDSADVYLTKPGGISTSEAAVKGLPMVLVDTVGGCEAHNAAYFVERGLAVTAETVPDLTNLCMAALASPQRRAPQLYDTSAAEIIYQTMAALP